MMTTCVSEEGQIILPDSVRSQLGIRSGDALGVEVDGCRIVLTRQAARRYVAEVIDDPITGLPVIDIKSEDGSHVPVLTSREVESILAEFP